MLPTDMLETVERTASPWIMETVVLQSDDDGILDEFVDTIDESLRDLINYLPDLLVAIIILAIGYLIASGLQSFVAGFVSRFGIDNTLRGTEIGETIQQPRSDGGANPSQPPQNQGAGRPPGTRQHGPVASAAGVAVKYYVLLFAAFLAAERLGIPELSDWLQGIIDYAPSFFAGTAVIIVGLVFADYAGKRTRNSELARESNYGVWITGLVRGVLYAIVLIVGLEMVGFDLEIVYIVADGVVSTIGVGLTFAIAVAIGIAGGLAARDYYQENLAD